MIDLENYDNALRVLVLGGSGQVGSEIRAYKDKFNFSMSFPSSSELDLRNLTSILKIILESEDQIILTGIEGEEMHKSLEKLTNFTQINL